MARATRVESSSKGRPTSRKIKHANRSTQQVRSKTTGKVKAPTLDDVYEYAPSKTRRSKVVLHLDPHEMEGRRYGSDDEVVDLGDMGTEAKDKLRARLLGENEDDERLDSDDDEEIESDDAFDESEKEVFAGSSFNRKVCVVAASLFSRNFEHSLQNSKLHVSSKAKSSKDFPEVDLNEEMEDDSAGEFFDILDVFDGKADVEEAKDNDARRTSKESKSTLQDDREHETKVRTGTGTEADDTDERSDVETDEDNNGKDEEEEAEEDDEELHISASDSEDASPEALAELENFISNLDPADTKKRKPDDTPFTDARIKKRRMVAERTEAGEEGEFGVRGSITLQLDDLLAPLASTSTALASLKKSTKPLGSSSSKTKTLSAPLPQRTQERLDREAAYEQTKEEVDKWAATMKRIKQAEHLSFPLQAERPGRVSTLELAAKFTPSNELESAVDKLLKSAQLRDEDIASTEALKLAHLSVEEVAARRAELRMMRELAFRADRKAKRIAKIKSKTYRRIRKKQRDHLDGPQEEDEEDEGARMKAEVERAKERATLRHKTTGKWAQAMQGREGLDQDQRRAISDMLERGEKLRRRIRGEESGEESDDDSASEDEEQDEDAIKRGAFEELVALRAEDDNATADLKSKSVFNMKFMRDAAARQSREADAQAEELEKELGFGLAENSDSNDTNEGMPTTDGPQVHRTGGRLSFRPGTSATVTAVPRQLGSLASDTSSVTLQSADLRQETHLVESTPTPTLSTPTTATAIVNPWLVPAGSSGASRKKNEASVHKGADATSKSTHKLKKQAAKRQEEKARARDDATMEIDVDNVLLITDEPVAKPRGNGQEKAKRKEERTYTGNDDDSDAHSEIEEQESALNAKNQGNGKGVQAFQQRDLVARAFAGDNVVQAFEEAKQREIEADAPRQVDTTLPGWGSWGGSGTKKLPPKPHLIKKIAGVDPSSRSDFKKAHVIISEKRDKKAAKYLVKDLPYPYTSHAQFARRMDTPLGTEWNTRVGFQRGTLPRVVKKMGAVIDPLEKLF
ncbi:Utp14 protein-domain-containing protein [Phlebopus sp. FC_14]|nr:Utp14 protein-domain-containing protein [Phlebopus sp. FC_14]